MQRKIIHIDMDCFFAAIECRDDPSVAELPVGVGGDSGRGVLTTCNYKARAFGVRSAMPVFMAKEKCPELILKPIRFEVYREESRKIRRIFREYTDLVEPLSLDEAYLEVTGQERFAWDIAQEIRKRIWAETRLTASAGIGPNKMIAKIASDWRKPNGQFAVLPKDVSAFMKTLPVRKIPGIGPKSESRLKEAGIESCGDLQQMEKSTLVSLFGPSWAIELYALCRGIDDRAVIAHRVRKSHGCERTFERNLETIEACEIELRNILDELRDELSQSKTPREFKKVFLKLKFANFQTTTKECLCDTLDRSVFRKLLDEAFGRSPHAVRLLGVGVRFPEAKEEDDRQLRLFNSDTST